MASGGKSILEMWLEDTPNSNESSVKKERKDFNDLFNPQPPSVTVTAVPATSTPRSSAASANPYPFMTCEPTNASFPSVLSTSHSRAALSHRYVFKSHEHSGNLASSSVGLQARIPSSIACVRQPTHSNPYVPSVASVGVSITNGNIPSSHLSPTITKKSQIAISPVEVKEEPIDIFSVRGAFGWSSCKEIMLPYIFRKIDKLIPVRIVENKIIGKYSNCLPWKVFSCINIRSFFITEAEAKLLNEINSFHCDYYFGMEPFTSKDVVVCLNDVQLLARFLETSKLVFEQGPASCGFLGFVQCHQWGQVIPYLIKETKNECSSTTSDKTDKIQQANESKSEITYQNSESIVTEEEQEDDLSKYFPEILKSINRTNRNLNDENQASVLLKEQDNDIIREFLSEENSRSDCDEDRPLQVVTNLNEVEDVIDVNCNKQNNKNSITQERQDASNGSDMVLSDQDDTESGNLISSITRLKYVPRSLLSDAYIHQSLFEPMNEWDASYLKMLCIYAGMDEVMLKLGKCGSKSDELCFLDSVQTDIHLNKLEFSEYKANHPSPSEYMNTSEYVQMPQTHIAPPLPPAPATQPPPPPPPSVSSYMGTSLLTTAAHSPQRASLVNTINSQHTITNPASVAHASSKHSYNRSSSYTAGQTCNPFNSSALYQHVVGNSHVKPASNEPVTLVNSNRSTQRATLPLNSQLLPQRRMSEQPNYTTSAAHAQQNASYVANPVQASRSNSQHTRIRDSDTTNSMQSPHIQQQQISNIAAGLSNTASQFNAKSSPQNFDPQLLNHLAALLPSNIDAQNLLALNAQALLNRSQQNTAFSQQILGEMNAQQAYASSASTNGQDTNSMLTSLLRQNVSLQQHQQQQIQQNSQASNNFRVNQYANHSGLLTINQSLAGQLQTLNQLSSLGLSSIPAIAAQQQQQAQQSRTSSTNGASVSGQSMANDMANPYRLFRVDINGGTFRAVNLMPYANSMGVLISEASQKMFTGVTCSVLIQILEKVFNIPLLNYSKYQESLFIKAGVKPLSDDKLVNVEQLRKYSNSIKQYILNQVVAGYNLQSNGLPIN